MISVPVKYSSLRGSLPESQLDRFLFKFKMSELSSEEELDLLNAGSRHEDIKHFQSLYQKSSLQELKDESLKIKIPVSIKEWVVDFLQQSRRDPDVVPLSSRAGLDFILALQSYTFVCGKNQVSPEEVVTLLLLQSSQMLLYKQGLLFGCHYS